MYGGAGIFLLHLIKNKFKIQKSTAKYIILPSCLGLLIKWGGYYWVDRKV